MKLQAEFWYRQSRFREAKSEALCAVSTYEKIGATKGAEECRAILQNIEEAMNELTASQKQHFDGEILEALLFPMDVNSPLAIGELCTISNPDSESLNN